ncbi:MAG: hypothetical protein AAGF12_37690, partial [Myxococcota bacterium]
MASKKKLLLELEPPAPEVDAKDLASHNVHRARDKGHWDAMGGGAIVDGAHAAYRTSAGALNTIRDMRIGVRELSLGKAAHLYSRGPDGDGAQQRLRIEIPEVSTQLTMGAANITPENTDHQNNRKTAFFRNYAGFGLTTKGHVFLEADGPAAESKMLLQSHGDLTVQSDEGALYLGSKNSNVFHSAKTSFLHGGGGVIIAGGTGYGTNPNVAPDASSPGAPPWLEKLPPFGAKIGALYAIADAVFDAAGLLSSVSHDKLEASGGRLRTFIGALSGASSLIPNVDTLQAYARGADSLTGGTVIHGEAGTVIGSSLTTSLYGATGISMTSPAVAGILGGVTSIYGMSQTDIGSYKLLTLRSQGTAELLAWNKVTIGSRESPVYIAGTGVRIGVRRKRGPQLPTVSTQVVSTREILLVAGESTAAEIGLDGNTGDARVHAKGSLHGSGSDVTFDGEKMVSLTTGSALVRVTLDSAALSYMPPEMERPTEPKFVPDPQEKPPEPPHIPDRKFIESNRSEGLSGLKRKWDEEVVAGYPAKLAQWEQDKAKHDAYLSDKKTYEADERKWKESVERQKLDRARLE